MLCIWIYSRSAYVRGYFCDRQVYYVSSQKLGKYFVYYSCHWPQDKWLKNRQWGADVIKFLLVASGYGGNQCFPLQRQATLLDLHGNMCPCWWCETKSLKTPKGCFGVAFSGVLLIWKTEKHAVIEMCYLVDVTGLLAIEKNKSCFLEIAQKFSLVVFPFKDDL